MGPPFLENLTIERTAYGKTKQRKQVAMVMRHVVTYLFTLFLLTGKRLVQLLLLLLHKLHQQPSRSYGAQNRNNISEEHSNGRKDLIEVFTHREFCVNR